MPSADQLRRPAPDPHPPRPQTQIDGASAPESQKHVFLVEGEGQFPLDMLRQEQCWPARPQDSRAITWRPDDATPSWRQIELITLNARGPRRDRWRTKAWRVID